MREKGEEYLPQHIEEEDDVYDLRVTSTVLLNAFEEAVDGVVSRVFAEPVIVTEEAHDEFVDAADDITGLGENLDGFARRAFQSAIAYGIAWILVDMPQIAPEIEEEVDGQKITRGRTLADDKKENIRPHWFLYPALNLPGSARMASEFVCAVSQTVHPPRPHLRQEKSRLRLRASAECFVAPGATHGSAFLPQPA
jgi:hypothetical protein